MAWHAPPSNTNLKTLVHTSAVIRHGLFPFLGLLDEDMRFAQVELFSKTLVRDLVVHRRQLSALCNVSQHPLSKYLHNSSRLRASASDREGYDEAYHKRCNVTPHSGRRNGLSTISWKSISLLWDWKGESRWTREAGKWEEIGRKGIEIGGCSGNNHYP
jgi:hypothetical protein